MSDDMQARKQGGKINVQFILPFMSAVERVFEDMLRWPVQRIEVYEKLNYVMFGDITGVIGISGEIAGTAALSLPEETATSAVAKLLDDGNEALTRETLHDGVGELINLIAGHAKATLAKDYASCNLTLPLTVSGEGHELYRKTGTRCVAVVFETPDGDAFTVEVCAPNIEGQEAAA